MLELRNIVKAYGATHILDGVDLNCQKGEAICIMGANAAGKTTLLSIAAGILPADKGTRSCDGMIGFVPQEPSLLWDLSVRDNLSLWYAAYHLQKKDIFSAESVETLLGLTRFAKTKAGKLSGGLKKRLAIACALLGNPAYLLLDEPFAALDIHSRENILSILHLRKKQGVGMLFISHDPSAAAALADRVLLLRDGGICKEVIMPDDPKAGTAQMIELLCEV